MQWTLVNSSRMSAVAWEDNTTYIQFPDGAIYSYANVSHDQHIVFVNSPSLGSALVDFQRLHPYKRIN